VWAAAFLLGFKEVNASPSTYFTFRDESRAFEDIGLWDTLALTLNLTFSASFTGNHIVYVAARHIGDDQFRLASHGHVERGIKTPSPAPISSTPHS